MFKGKATLLVDLGNSATRFQVICNTRSSDIVSLSNQYTVVPSNYKLPASYADTGSIIFECDGKHFAHGDVALREFASYLIKPSAIQTKADSLTTKLAAPVVFYHAYEQLSKLVGTQELDVEWTVGMLCPPIQMATKEALQAIFKSVRVNITSEGFEVSPVIKEVKVFPEGVAAFFALVFNEDFSMKEGFEGFKDSSLMILDIGAGTTDLCVVEGFRVIEDTLDSYPIGGNNVYQQVGKLLKAEGRNVREDLLVQGVISGVIPDGAAQVSVADKVVKVKEKIAQSLKGNIRKSFESTMFDPRGIQYLLVVGGGALEGITTSLGTFLLESIRELSSNIELIKVPDAYDLRLLNIQGLRLLTMR